MAEEIIFCMHGGLFVPAHPGKQASNNRRATKITLQASTLFPSACRKPH